MNTADILDDRSACRKRLLAGTVLAVFIIQLLCRLLIFHEPTERFLEQLAHFPDIDLYFKYASTILAGNPYAVGECRALRAPGLPLLLAIGHEQPYLLVGMIASANIVLVYALGKWLEGRGAPRCTALSAMLLAMLDPYSFVLGLVPLSETPFTFLMLLSLYLGCCWIDRPRTWIAMAMGFVAASAVYVRPSGLAFYGIAWVIALFATLLVPATSRWQRSRDLLLSATVFVATMFPWWYRNHQIFGTIVITTTNVGESLYDGWNERADGSSNFWFKQNAAEFPTGELDQDRHFRQKAIDWAIANPARVVELGGIKFLRFWSLWPNEERLRSWPVVLITTPLTLLIYGAALFGWGWSVRQSPRLRVTAMATLLPIAIFCVMHLIFVSSVRYRVPLIPLLALWGGVSVARTIMPTNSGARGVES
ncbi:hypothetical protein K2X85_04765 [bacterium]|nr:hypothetical protein [bacterium]